MLCTSNNLLPAKYLFNSLKPENHLLNIARYSLFLSETLIVVFSIFLLISLGKKFVSNIPGYANGTNYTPDTFIAGENGAELITGSRNKKVYDALETKNIFDSINLLNLQKTEPERIENKDNINSNIVLNITNSPVIYADNTDDLDTKLKNNNERLIQTIYEQINEKALKERRMFYR